MKRFCFLYNPSTNRKRSHHKFKQLKDYTSNWPGVAYRTSKNRHDLYELASEAADSFDVVAACGGDGTVRDVAVAIQNSNPKTILAVVPLGSGNDFYKSLGLPVGLTEALKVLKAGQTQPMDLGKCNDFYFINTLGFGFDGQTNLYASQSSIQVGTLRYILAALKTIFKMKPFKAQLQVEGYKVPEEEWIMITVANGRVEGGNFVVAPQASLFDQLFTLLTVRPVSKLKLPFLLPFFLMGRPGLLSKTSYYEAGNITIQFDQPVFIHADGEQIETTGLNFHIELIPGAINVIC